MLDLTERLDEPAADCVIGFSFGYDLVICDKQRKIIPGSSNQEIAKVISSLMSHDVFKSLPLIIQWEIADCEEELGSAAENLVLKIKEHYSIPGKYLDTYEVAFQAACFMSERGLKTALVVAHPAHFWRCQKVLEKLGIGVFERSRIQWIHYNPKSAQRWTRNPFFWWLREIPTLSFYWFKGWI